MGFHMLAWNMAGTFYARVISGIRHVCPILIKIYNFSYTSL
jgi:hypothetical protein